MDFSAIRSRLAGTEGRLFWRSLGELADTPQFREYLHREFPEQAAEWNDPKGRRQFLKLMSASLALAGVGACVKQPPEKIIPYVTQPEEIVPGKPLFFATAYPFAGIGIPVLVESHEGHPTKVEGNPEHPSSLGGTDIFAQAAILQMYDPDRAKTVIGRGETRGWGEFQTALRVALLQQKSKGGSGLRFLTEAMTSPTIAEQISLIQQAYPNAKWHQWDPIARDSSRAAANQAAGAPSDARYHFDKADVVVSLEADFLCGALSVPAQKAFASRRRLTDDNKSLSRLYVVESTPTLTGARSDHRLTLRASEIQAFAAALASAVGAGGGAAGNLSNANAQKWITAVAKDLQASRGTSIVIAGDYQPVAVHQLAHAMNPALGNVGTTVEYLPTVEINPTDQLASLRDLVGAMNAGQVEALVIVGVNPAFTAPADLNFQDALGKVAFSVHHSLYYDETSGYCTWMVPAAHAFESWSDVRALDGTVTIMQPLIAPLYEGRTETELFASFIDAQSGRSAHDLVKDYWTRAHAKQAGTWTITDPKGQPFHSPESFWKHALHDGFITGTAAGSMADGRGAMSDGRGAMGDGRGAMEGASGAAASTAAAATPGQSDIANRSSNGGLEIIFRPDPTIWDGRFANLGWMQELPKPLSTITWDPSAWISPKLAQDRKLEDGDLIELKYRGKTAKLPVWIMPGHPDGAVTAFFGYGRRMTGRVGTPADEVAKDFNIYTLRTSDAPWFASGLEISKVGRYLLARVQEHHAMEGRAPIRMATLAEYEAEGTKVIQKQGEKPPRALSIMPEWEYNSYRWAMAIDLATCTGCSTCTIACQSENNIPVVGKEQVDKGREMHWIRVDHYFVGNPEDADSVESHHQPRPCMQCETAPCELVCPVGATVHSAEGLNDMVYNRCVGTRYCSNNCPYKVRRFNFLLYQDWDTQSLYPMRNPDVTVRSRGVMEKCTYCVQRINYARITAKREDRRIQDGEVVPACAAACPSDAIVFGDLNDPNSRVNKLRAQHRNYGVLEDLNTRPRTTYLADVRNPNPEIDGDRGSSKLATEH
jgi:molybdopterin-containing oxidoreductase family iron-sulfur binding subunit